MTEPEIPFHRPFIGDEERAAVDDVLASGWLTTGPRVKAFEARFADFVGARHAVALNSATAALHLALDGLGVTEGDEVIVPTYTFAASGEVVAYQRARPILVDIDPTTLNLDPEAVRAALTRQTKAVEVVHLGGLPADVAAIEALTDVPVIEDAAHAFPSRVTSADGRLAGTLGRAGAYSFYATKTITTGEGGMLVTDDDGLADRARQMSLHGISRDAWKRYTAAGSWYYEIERAGFKDNMTDIAAAIGLAQLDRADALRDMRGHIARRYLDLLAPLADADRIILPAAGQGDEHAWHLFIVRLRDADAVAADPNAPGVAILPPALQALATRRAAVVDALRAAGIGASVHFIPLHLHPLYRSQDHVPGDFPQAEAAYAGAISLPIWPGMSDGDVERVAATLGRTMT